VIIIFDIFNGIEETEDVSSRVHVPSYEFGYRREEITSFAPKHGFY
jgi:hypothetical protein